jgi:hypothetical protein
METGLSLLMRGGAVRVAFHPHLTAEQYADLLERVARAETKAKLRQEVQEAARRWGNRLDFDTEIA